ncbi:hypothetical protein DL771_006253 [Monosporascus sp. 5C6A]|nr:hypothetical protein DL771_006253 [Monosporascus sp. 5C6A]
MGPRPVRFNDHGITISPSPPPRAGWRGRSRSATSRRPRTPRRGGPGGPGWDEAYAKAREFVSQITLPEKVDLTTGTGHQGDLCVGKTGSLPRLGFRHFCLQNGPHGVGSTDGNSVFPSGLTAVATVSRNLLRRRGYAMGEEHRGKGVDGFSPDPYLSGVALAETVIDTQDAGVIANAKHFILNEQEHFRNHISSNLDDKSMHELYLRTSYHSKGSVGRDKTRIPVNFSTWLNATTGYRHLAAGPDNKTVSNHANVQGNHAELIREIAAKGTVLLKNENSALPLTKPSGIAMIGRDAQSGPDGPNACLHKYCTAWTLAVGWGSGAADFPYLIAPADVLKQAEADGKAFNNVEGN